MNLCVINISYGFEKPYYVQRKVYKNVFKPTFHLLRRWATGSPQYLMARETYNILLNFNTFAIRL